MTGGRLLLPFSRRGILKSIIGFSAVALIATATYAVLQGTSSPSTPRPPASAGAAAYMSPGRHGDCSADDPCDNLNAAINVVAGGGAILAAGGDYGDQTVKRSDYRDNAQNQIVIKPSTVNAKPLFGKVLMSTSHVTFQSLSFDGLLYLYEGAHNTVVTGSTFSGPGVSILIRASDVQVVDSVLQGGVGHDGINIAGNPAVSNITIRGNTIHHFQSARIRNSEHPDCIQVFDAKMVTIEQNSLYDCYNSGITFSAGARLGVSGVVVQGNFIQGCLPQEQACGQGGSAMDMRLQVTDALVSHNTFGKGVVRLPANPGVLATGNIINFLSVGSCETAVTNSLIVSYNKWACKQTPGAGQLNWTTTIGFVDSSTNNLRLIDPVPDGQVPPGLNVPPGPGMFGPMSADTVGATS